jgi:hypothetical protein
LTVKRLNKLPKTFREKAVRHFCNEEDLKPDEEKDMIVWKNPNFEEINDRLSKRKTYQDLAEIFSTIYIGTFPGDFYDMNDGYPVLTKRSSRRRMYLNH